MPKAPLVEFARGKQLSGLFLITLEEAGYIKRNSTSLEYELSDLGITKLAHMGYCEHGYTECETCTMNFTREERKDYSDLVGECTDTVKVASGYKTLRDEFAIAALTGLLAGVPTASTGIAARRAYKFADEMMEARDAKQSDTDRTSA